MNQIICKNQKKSVMANTYGVFIFPLWDNDFGDGFCKYINNN